MHSSAMHYTYLGIFSQLDATTCDDEIDLLLSEPKYMTLVDSSKWSVITSVNSNTKGEQIDYG